MVARVVLSAADEVRFRAWWQDGVPVRTIGRWLGRADDTVIGLAARLGLPARPRMSLVRMAQFLKSIQEERAVAVTRLPCIRRTCTNEVQSTGRHHRMCDRCRGISDVGDYALVGVRIHG